MSSIRVRFAPSPTGFMHLGNVRAALINYLFARQKGGTFILRIEDTDNQRNFDEARTKIIEDLAWLGLSYQEGPLVGGAYGPYQQSERTALYQEKLAELVSLGRVYRCFCTNEQLEEKRKLQQAAGKPPRYDRTCLLLSSDKIQRKVEAGIPFIWRFKINEHQLLSIRTVSGHSIEFDMQHFSDFAISRNDGSFTFIFVNFIDDWLMNISHVIRGEDHLSNTASQAAMYDACAVKMPTFWHLPIICNDLGEKLSKRDFGFSLNDLREGGFLPEAIINYLAVMGASVAEEVQSKEDLAKILCFEKLTSHGGIRYDLAKLQWFNHQWLNKIPLERYLKTSFEWLAKTYGDRIYGQEVALERLLILLRSEIKTYTDLAPLTRFYFEDIQHDAETLATIISIEKREQLFYLLDTQLRSGAHTFGTLLEHLKKEVKPLGISTKELLQTLRYLLTGSTHGIGVNDLFAILPEATVITRLKMLLP